MLPFVAWLAEHGPMLLAGCTLLLGAGWSASLLARSLAARQRLAELAVVAR
jgi:hypothetical protein